VHAPPAPLLDPVLPPVPVLLLLLLDPVLPVVLELPMAPVPVPALLLLVAPVPALLLLVAPVPVLLLLVAPVPVLLLPVAPVPVPALLPAPVPVLVAELPLAPVPVLPPVPALAPVPALPPALPLCASRMTSPQPATRVAVSASVVPRGDRIDRKVTRSSSPVAGRDSTARAPIYPRGHSLALRGPIARSTRDRVALARSRTGRTSRAAAAAER